MLYLCHWQLNVTWIGFDTETSTFTWPKMNRRNIAQMLPVHACHQELQYFFDATLKYKIASHNKIICWCYCMDYKMWHHLKLTFEPHPLCVCCVSLENREEIWSPEPFFYDSGLSSIIFKPLKSLWRSTFNVRCLELPQHNRVMKFMTLIYLNDATMQSGDTWLFSYFNSFFSNEIY